MKKIARPYFRYIRWLWIPLVPLLLPVLIFFPIFIWNSFVLPIATVHYSQDALHELQYIWNVQDRIYKGRVFAGSVVVDHGFLFPDPEFFMEFSWGVENQRWHCISIKPKWPSMHIFLDANGNIDMRKGSSTDVDRLKECQWELAKP